MNQGSGAADNPVVCEAEDSFMCSVALDASTAFVTKVTVSISDAIASPFLLRIPARPGKEGIHVILYFVHLNYLFMLHSKWWTSDRYRFHSGQSLSNAA